MDVSTNSALLVMDMQQGTLARVAADKRPVLIAAARTAIAGATSGIVLSTARQAMDLDFQCIVVPDACADLDDEVHRVLCDKVFAKHNQIVAAAELAAVL